MKFKKKNQKKKPNQTNKNEKKKKLPGIVNELFKIKCNELVTPFKYIPHPLQLNEPANQASSPLLTPFWWLNMHIILNWF